MPTLNVTVAGLIALIIKKDFGGNAVEAKAVLVKSHHDHFPMLLVPKNCVSDDTGLKKYPDPVSLLVLAKVEGAKENYHGYDLRDVHLKVTNRPSSAGISLVTEPAPSMFGCPEGNNWDSLNWLLNLNESTLNPTVPIRMNKRKLHQTSTDISSLLNITQGTLKGHAPVEISRKIHKISYDGRRERAFTDASEWSTTVNGDIAIEFTSRKTSKKIGTLKLIAGDCRAMLLNLPTAPAPPGGHIDAFRNMPFADRTTVGDAVIVGACSRGTGESRVSTSGKSTLTLTVSSDGPAPVELTLSATARFGSAEPDHHVDDTGNEPEPRGDSLCMSLVINVDAV
jgi:hypothetical protein